MPVNVLPKIAGIPDWKQIERELRETFERIENELAAIRRELREMKNGGSR